MPTFIPQWSTPIFLTLYSNVHTKNHTLRLDSQVSRCIYKTVLNLTQFWVNLLSRYILIVLKTKDICEALNIKRHHLRAWTDTLKPYCNQSTQERSARKFDTGDLLFFAVIQHIESKFGVSTLALSDVSQCIHDTIRSPRIMNTHELIFLDIDSKKCLIADRLNMGVEGLLINIAPAKNVVCEFLGVMPTQSQLHLGLARVS